MIYESYRKLELCYLGFVLPVTWEVATGDCQVQDRGADPLGILTC
jgi:hypothetical protein